MNSRQVIKVFTCSTILSYNLTKTRIDLISKPLQNALQDFRENIPRIGERFREIQDKINPLIKEIEGDDINTSTRTRAAKQIQDYNIKDPLVYQQKYTRKLSERCHKIIQKGINTCRKSFATAYTRCIDNLPSIINYLLCWPMKMEFLCKITQIVGNICEPKVGPELGDNYQDLIIIQNKLINNTTKIQMKFKPRNIMQIKPVELVLKLTFF